MKSLNLVLLSLLFVFSFVFNSWGENINKKWCREWCGQHSPLCKKCAEQAGCGPGYSPIVTFKIGPGKNWHACSGMERNKEACEDWCRQNKPRCVKCSDHVGCGQGLTAIMHFSGQGKNWHACRKTMHEIASEGNKAACEAWCAAHAGCVKCDTLRGCGPGFKAMKHFTGRGKNWHACRKK